LDPPPPQPQQQHALYVLQQEALAALACLLQGCATQVRARCLLYLLAHVLLWCVGPQVQGAPVL